MEKKPTTIRVDDQASFEATPAYVRATDDHVSDRAVLALGNRKRRRMLDAKMRRKGR